MKAALKVMMMIAKLDTPLKVIEALKLNFKMKMMTKLKYLGLKGLKLWLILQI